MRTATGKNFFLQATGSAIGNVLAKVMPLAGALAFGGGGPVLGGCSPDQAGLAAVARAVETAGLAIIVDCDGDGDPALAQVMAQDNEALPHWAQARAAEADVAIPAAAEPAVEATKEPTLPPQVVWNEWRIDTLRRERTTATSHLYQPSKVTTIRQPGQALQLRLYVPL